MAGDGAFGQLEQLLAPLEKGQKGVLCATAYVNGEVRTVAGPVPDTLFEAGSISKAFTGLLLADMVVRKELRLEDTLNRHLPEKHQRPDFDRIDLAALATHTSGFPRLPGSLYVKLLLPSIISQNPGDPYRDYSEENLFADLATVKLSPPPAKFSYSNFGFGLLGYLLAREQPGGLEALMRERLFEPMGMTDTFLYYQDGDDRVPPASKAKAIPGYSPDGKPTSPWNFPEPIAGAGAVKSTPKDMARLFRLALEGKPATLQPAWVLATTPREDTTFPETRIGLGWFITDHGKTRIIWHNGQTGGFCSFIGFCPEKKLGVCILTNVGEETGITQAGLQWMVLAQFSSGK